MTKNHGAIFVPIYNVSVFSFPNAENDAAIHNYLNEGYFYSKFGNPT
ncbi:MAG: PLP-dependent transferase [Acidobacteria bacterium]|nr:PLP-dependent transferase [Acidobacteriota bacterium]